jgi:hypothetical protein
LFSMTRVLPPYGGGQGAAMPIRVGSFMTRRLLFADSI